MANKLNYIYTRSKIRHNNRKLYKEILENYNYKCAICGWYIEDSKTFISQGGCDLHHITAYRDGGKETKDNLILLCPNHHKMADIGTLSKEALLKHIVIDLSVRQRTDNLVDRLKRQHNKIIK